MTDSLMYPLATGLHYLSARALLEATASQTASVPIFAFPVAVPISFEDTLPSPWLASMIPTDLTAAPPEGGNLA